MPVVKKNVAKKRTFVKKSPRNLQVKKSSSKGTQMTPRSSAKKRISKKKPVMKNAKKRTSAKKQTGGGIKSSPKKTIISQKSSSKGSQMTPRSSDATASRSKQQSKKTSLNQEEWKKISKDLKKKLPTEIILEIEKHLVFNFAVVEWVVKWSHENGGIILDNIKYSFHKGFDSFEEAKQEAYKLAEKKSPYSPDYSQKLMKNQGSGRENKKGPKLYALTPGHFLPIDASPYFENAIIEYCIGEAYASNKFASYNYAVVKWFDGVKDEIKMQNTLKQKKAIGVHS